MSPPHQVHRRGRINWGYVTKHIGLPIVGVVLACWTRAHHYTIIFSIIYGINSGFGITAGYHRLWSHRSYNATLPLKIYLAAIGTGAAQGSVHDWSEDHRAHHQYTDTDRDPYSVHKGLFHAHIGWLLFRQDPKPKHASVLDLERDPIAAWQHRHYFILMVVAVFVFPILTCGLGWGDWLGGLTYASLLRTFIVQQATFCVNSLAHWFGDQPYDSKTSPRNNTLVSLITLGEGYHNFHHRFPSDYRNGVKWYQIDPTKWLIYTWASLGLAYDLKEIGGDDIGKRLAQSKSENRRRKVAAH